MKILGIETSCDDTSVAIVDDKKNIISNLILSQTDLHKEFGGVVPELAARSHAQTLDKLITKTLSDTQLALNDLDAVAVTAGPGLIGGVIVGLMMGKALASVHKKPFIAVNHLEAHALTARLTDDVEFPYLLLLVSGGHCQILIVKGVSKYQKLGGTIDDALGEAFDKVAIMLGLDYPGGPKIEKSALNGDCNRFNFPKPLISSKKNNGNDLNFSFSGLKTAVRREIEKLAGSSYMSAKLSDRDIVDIAASFQRTVVEIIIDRLKNALEFINQDNQKITNLVMAGGVAANQYLYQKIAKFMKQNYDLVTICPPSELCTDNAAMVAWAGIEKLKLNMVDNLSFKPRARWELEDLVTQRLFSS